VAIIQLRGNDAYMRVVVVRMVKRETERRNEQIGSHQES
jgi:hypothetical protein